MFWDIFLEKLKDFYETRYGKRVKGNDGLNIFQESETTS